MGSVPSFGADVESRNGVARIALSGELDLAAVPIVNEQLSRFEQAGVDEIMLDLRDLTFVDSMGLHAFLEARERADSNGHRLTLVGASPSARRLFELTDTQFLMDEQDAVSVLDRFIGGPMSWTGPTSSDVAGPDA
jgi:anti-anti-sigma factor